MQPLERRTFLQSAAAASLSLGWNPLAGEEAPEHNTTAQANLIIMIADGICWYDLPCYGNPDLNTPHLDSLARDGMQLQNMHNTTALCAPCRSEVFTGLFPYRNGRIGNGGSCKPGTKSLVHYLKPLGYQVCLSGKSHVAPEEVFPWDTPPNTNKKKKNQQPRIEDVFKSPKPFCLIKGFTEPHGPYKTVDPKFGDDFSMPADLPDIASQRKRRAGYYTAIERLDVKIGDLLKKLKKSGKEDNTLIIFLTEHGLAPHGKRSCWQSGVKAGALVRWPGKIQAGSSSSALMHYVDVLPTCVEAAGGQAPAVDGKSFLSVLTEQNQQHRDVLFHQFSAPPNYPQRAIRKGPYKLILNPSWERGYTGGISKMTAPENDAESNFLIKRQRDRPPMELYHIEDDPWEFTNLAGEAAHRQRIEALRTELFAWMEQQKDEAILQLAKKLAIPTAAQIHSVPSSLQKASQQAATTGKMF